MSKPVWHPAFGTSWASPPPPAPDLITIPRAVLEQVRKELEHVAAYANDGGILSHLGRSARTADARLGEYLP